MKCRECGSDMYVDDVDFGFKGKYDQYFMCPNCQTSCIVQVRFSRIFRELWHSENNGVKDVIVTYDRFDDDKVTVEEKRETNLWNTKRF